MKKSLRGPRRIYLLLLFLVVFLFPIFASANSWTRQTSSGANLWWAVSGSSDATKLIAVPDYGYVYKSVDSGEHWTEDQSLGEQSWMDAVSSSDGSKMVIAVDSGSIFYSSNGGTSWNTSSADPLEWGSLAASADGSIVYATAGFWSNDVIYKSTDYGATFSPLTSGSYKWRDITTSADGTIVVAVVLDGAIYYSGDSGATWNLSDSGNKSWRAVTSSSDGHYVAAAVSLGGAIYTSSDYGATWTITSSGNKDWRAIASSADGSKLVAVEFSGLIYSSTDSGANWGIEAGAGTGDWRDIFSSADGEKLVALNYTDPEPGSGGYIFTYGPALISVTAPVVVTVGTTQSTSTAQLIGNITSDGNASSTDRGFHYGLTTSYGSTSSSTGTFGIGSYSKDISNLNCGTLYHYRAFAINSAGTGTSTDSTFTTSACEIPVTVPTIITPSSGSITATGVTLTATVSSDGNASSTDHGFNYGLTTAYGSVASTTSSFGIGSFSESITGLTCNTLYHYRGFVTNSAGTASTTDANFTTSACPSNPPAHSSSGGGGGTSLLTRAISFLNKSGIFSSNSLVINVAENDKEITNYLNSYIYTDTQNKQIKTLWKELHDHGYGISISTFKEVLSKLAINPINSIPINSIDNSSNSHGTVSAVFLTGLYKGLNSDDVVRLQKLLSRDKIIYPEAMVTGFFGGLTEKAVQRFQIKYGVVTSAQEVGYGYVGPKTRAKILEVFGK